MLVKELEYSVMWIYTFAPFVGGIAAGLAWVFHRKALPEWQLEFLNESV